MITLGENTRSGLKVTLVVLCGKNASLWLLTDQ